MELMSFLKQVPLFAGLTGEQYDERERAEPGHGSSSVGFMRGLRDPWP